MKRLWLKKRLLGPGLFAFVAVLTLLMALALRPPSREASPRVFKVEAGEGFLEIANRLKKEQFIRSSFALKTLSILSGRALRLKPGSYEISPSWSASRILKLLVLGPELDVEISIPEGTTIFGIDAILSEKGIIPAGSLVKLSKNSKEPLEGKLFPDTYRFFRGSTPEEVVTKIRAAFETKAAPLLKDVKDATSTLILASILEREVPDFEERKLVAHILLKRLSSGIALQADATVCYVKELAAGKAAPCLPLTSLDLKRDSPYNTYTRRGLPPAPIGNPGIEALKAALQPAPSPYWYYLSDPKTKRTVFARTFEEHLENKAKYIR